MDRNFFRRIELMFPIRDEGLRARIIADLDTYLADNAQAWELRADGRYTKLTLDSRAETTAAQLVLLRQLAEAA
jgi:polyphosphate kinase